MRFIWHIPTCATISRFYIVSSEQNMSLYHQLYRSGARSIEKIQSDLLLPLLMVAKHVHPYAWRFTSITSMFHVSEKEMKID